MDRTSSNELPVPGRYLLDAIVKHVAEAVQQPEIDGQGRHDYEHVAERPQQQALITRRAADTGAQAQFRRERALARPVCDQLNAGHQTALTDVAHMRQLGKTSEVL